MHSPERPVVLSATKERNEQWNVFLQNCERKNKEKRNEYAILNLSFDVELEEQTKSTASRLYRSCRNSSAMKNSLINSYIRYEKKRSRTSVKPSNLSKNKNQSRTTHRRKPNNIPETSDDVVFKKPATPKKKKIEDINIVKTTSMKKVIDNDVCSSGYHTSESRSSIIIDPIVVVNRTKEFMETVVNHGLLQINRRLITIDILRYLSLGPNSADKGDIITRRCIRAYLKNAEHNIDVNIMTMLVQLIEKVTKNKLQRYILGMRILESLNRMEDGKYQLLCRKVKQEISNLFTFLHIDAIKIYVEYVLYMYEIRKK